MFSIHVIPEGLFIRAKISTNITIKTLIYVVFGLKMSLTIEFFVSSEATAFAGPRVILISNNVQSESSLKI